MENWLQWFSHDREQVSRHRIARQDKTRSAKKNIVRPLCGDKVLLSLFIRFWAFAIKLVKCFCYDWHDHGWQESTGSSLDWDQEARANWSRQGRTGSDMFKPRIKNSHGLASRASNKVWCDLTYQVAYNIKCNITFLLDRCLGHNRPLVYLGQQL